MYFSYIVMVSFIDGGNRSIRRKPHNVVSSTVHITMNGIQTQNFSGDSHWFHMYSQTCIKSAPLEQRKSRLLRQVMTS